MTIMVGLVTMSAPMYGRAIEQARLDTAARNLRTLWTAQRVYWLERHTYADDLATLGSMDLVSSALASSQGSATAPYAYSIDSADGSSFTASMTRKGSRKWSGTIRIDESGSISGYIMNSSGAVLSPIVGE